MLMFPKKSNSFVRYHLVLYETFRDLRYTNSFARSFPHATRRFRDWLALMTAPARQVAVRPMLEANELLRSSEVHRGWMPPKTHDSVAIVIRQPRR